MGLVDIKFIPGDENDVNIFTNAKKTMTAVITKHIPKCIGFDKHMNE